MVNKRVKFEDCSFNIEVIEKYTFFMTTHTPRRRRQYQDNDNTPFLGGNITKQKMGNNQVKGEPLGSDSFEIIAENGAFARKASKCFAH